ncbi:premelanosome protein a [Chanos chanos]|uniref:Premelanosome protein a n=1 Tax=Chanos chanos TaxID=29144 RepID=A0A6J2VPY4_CHACN|nr:melanocyte protein PMEL [Chanos chanos]
MKVEHTDATPDQISYTETQTSIVFTTIKTIMLILYLFSTTVSSNRKTRFVRYRSWNSRMYPVWRDGDPRYRDCWRGGEVAFDIKSDAPTLTGAKASFTINVRFPQNQTVLQNGQVVWARNCTVNGTQYTQGQAVYPERNTPDEWTGVFPDGTPFTRTSGRKPRYIFVWKTWGRYWQVADGPSSSLTIGTDNIPLGSYNMEVVIYHCRGKDKFIPLGYASTQFAITDQIPFAVTMSQVNDVNQADQSFIQNRAVAFSVNIHDPSQYLSGSDVTFNWDFGDNSGTLISRETTVTHTYLATGSFRPQVVLMAAIPNGCDPNPTPGGATSVPPPPPVEIVTTGEKILDPLIASAEVVVVSTAGAIATVNPPVPVPTEQPSDNTIAVPDNADDIALAASPQPDEAAPAADGQLVASVAPAAAEDAATGTDTEAADPAAAAAVPEDAAVEGVTVPAAAEAADDVTADNTDMVADADATEETAEAAVEEETAADETAAVDAVASIAPAVEGEDGTVDLAATILPETPAADAAAPAEEVVAVEATLEPEVPQVETVAPVANVINVAATDTAVVEVVETVAPAEEDEAVETVNEVAAVNEAETNEVLATAAPAAVNEIAAGVEVEAGTEAAPVALVVAKRQAPEMPADGNCMIYRYGSFSTTLDVVQGIESVEIVEVNNVVTLTTEVEQNAVDLTVTCQGSLPNEVCTVVSDEDCVTPVQTICNAVSPAPDCQMILRQFFNDSGVFCINISVTNDVSLAMASARVSVSVGSNTSAGGTVAAVLGVLVLACVVGTLALAYRRFKQYHPLREDSAGTTLGSSARTSMPLLLWNLLSRQSAGESRPLLQGRVV